MPPANDAFANAIALDPAGGALAGTTVAATSQVDEPVYDGLTGGLLRNDGSFTFQSVWYKITPTQDAAFQVSPGATAAGLDIVVYRGTTLANLEWIAENANADVFFAVFAGVTVYIQLYNYSGGTPPGEGIGTAQPFNLVWVPTTPLRSTIKVNGVSYGTFLAGARNSSGQGPLPGDHIRDVWFGSVFAGVAVDRQIRNIKVGTTGFGSSDLFAPALSSTAEFDSIQGASGDLTVSGGILAVANAGADVFAVKDLGVDYTSPIYVHFEVKVTSTETGGGFLPDFHDVAFGNPADFETDWVNGIEAYDPGSGNKFAFELGGDSSYSPFFGPAVTADTWFTFDVEWDFGGEPPPGPPVLVSSPDWRYVVTDRTSAIVTFLDKLATNRQITYILNQTAVATGDVPSDNPEVKIVHTDGRPFLSFNDRLLYAFRREGIPTPWVIRYAGILMQVDREAQTDQPVSHFTAYDPWQYWKEQRPIVNGIGVLPGKGGLSYSATKGNTIALALLTNSLAAHGSLYADFGQTAFYEGTIEDTDPLDINFQQGMNLGEALTALTDTGSIDIVLKPIYDPINRPGLLVEVSMFNQAGTKRNGAIFAWDMPSKSLEGLDLLHDGTQMANKSVAYAGQAGGASPVQTNAASVTHYGQYWLQRSLPGQIAPAAVRLLALAQLLLRRRGKTTLTISPSPERSPVPFNEFGLGDEVPVYASRNFGELLSAGTVGSDGKWSNLQRIYAIPLDISDDDVETVTSMLMTGPFDV